MQFKPAILIIFTTTAMIYHVADGGRSKQISLMSGERDAFFDANINFISSLMGTFIKRLLDPCELMGLGFDNQKDATSSTPEDQDSGFITLRYTVTGPLDHAITDIYPNIVPQMTVSSEQTIKLPLLLPTNTFCDDEWSHEENTSSDNNGNNEHKEDIYRYVNHIAINLETLFNSLVTWKPILDNTKRTGNMTMTVELAAETNTLNGIRFPHPVKFGYVGDRNIILPLQDEEVMLPDLHNFQEPWGADDRTSLRMDTRFREALEWVTCMEGARLEASRILEAENRKTLARDYYACEGRPWSNMMVLFPSGWTSGGSPSWARPEAAPTMGVKDKYMGDNEQDQGDGYGHGRAPEGDTDRARYEDLDGIISKMLADMGLHVDL